MKKRKTKKTFLRKALAALAVLVFLWAGAFAALWIAGLAMSTDGAADAIIVLGSQVLPSGEPNWVLERRLEAALARYERTPLPIICCGAKGPDEPVPEAESMKKWLVRHGVPEAMIRAEAASFNTYENLDNAKALLPAGTVRVLVVTSDYHLPRALAIARAKGLDASGLGSPVYLSGRLRNHTREMLSWLKFFWMKWTGKL